MCKTNNAHLMRTFGLVFTLLHNIRVMRTVLAFQGKGETMNVHLCGGLGDVCKVMCKKYRCPCLYMMARGQRECLSSSILIGYSFIRFLSSHVCYVACVWCKYLYAYVCI